MISKEIRRKNLNLLLESLCKGDRSTLARLLGYDGTVYVGGLLNGSNSFGDSVARKIEEKLKLDLGWMDSLHNSVKDEPEAYDSFPSSTKIDFILLSKIITDVKLAVEKHQKIISPSVEAQIIIAAYQDAISSGSAPDTSFYDGSILIASGSH